MDEQEKTRVTSLANTGAQIVGGVLSAVHPALGIPIAILRPVIAEFTSRRNASRKERLTQALAEKVAELPTDDIEKRVREEGFQDLLEEAVFQIARPVSQERIEQIATLLKHGLSEEDAEALRYKMLLGILGQMNDAEIIILQAFTVGHEQGHKAFYEKHEDLLTQPDIDPRSPQNEVEIAAIYSAYIMHIEALGLVDANRTDWRTSQLPSFDKKKRLFNVRNMRITPLGRLLLRAIETETQTAAEGA